MKSWHWIHFLAQVVTRPLGDCLGAILIDAVNAKYKMPTTEKAIVSESDLFWNREFIVASISSSLFLYPAAWFNDSRCEQRKQIADKCVKQQQTDNICVDEESRPGLADSVRSANKTNFPFRAAHLFWVHHTWVSECVWEIAMSALAEQSTPLILCLYN